MTYRDENTAETVETVLECSAEVAIRIWARGLPVLSSDVAPGIGWHTTAVDNYAADDKADNCGDLDNAEDEFDLTIALDTKIIYGDNDDQEDGNPNAYRNPLVGIPVLYGNSSSCQLEWKNYKPVESVVPTHGESPCWVDEAHGVVVERTVYRVPDKISFRT